MIIPSNEDELVTPRFVNELTGSNKTSLDNLKDFCLSKSPTMTYWVYLDDEKRLDVQAEDATVIIFNLDEMVSPDIDIVNSMIDTCNQLIS